jgi:hypothetical protein
LPSDFDFKEKDKNSCLDVIIHACDISNPIKPFHIYEQWTTRVLEEFWNQVKTNHKAIIYVANRAIKKGVWTCPFLI